MKVQRPNENGYDMKCTVADSHMKFQAIARIILIQWGISAEASSSNLWRKRLEDDIVRMPMQCLNPSSW
ncbi:MAG: hypothetical protein KAG53_10010 [Endozoicomonadaceae bacterium]|nr:hypothetical protein [Endozoicomonadaceae bacterium]